MDYNKLFLFLIFGAVVHFLCETLPSYFKSKTKEKEVELKQVENRRKQEKHDLEVLQKTKELQVVLSQLQQQPSGGSPTQQQLKNLSGVDIDISNISNIAQLQQQLQQQTVANQQVLSQRLLNGQEGQGHKNNSQKGSILKFLLVTTIWIITLVGSIKML